jgi:hypothetical protein
VIVVTDRLALALALLFITVGACDPDEVLGNAEAVPDPAKAAAKAAGERVAATKKAAEDHFSTCMAACIEGRAQSATDRQTCRLTCGADRISAGGSGPSPGTKTALARFETCLDADCAKVANATDAATCRLTCAQAALAGEAAPALRATARGCAVSCLEQTGDCEAACTGGPDDMATCKLQCTSLGEHCVERCVEDPSATPKLPAPQ